MSAEQVTAELQRKKNLGIAPTSQANLEQYNKLTPVTPVSGVNTHKISAGSGMLGQGAKGTGIGAGLGIGMSANQANTSNAGAALGVVPNIATTNNTGATQGMSAGQSSGYTPPSYGSNISN